MTGTSSFDIEVGDVENASFQQNELQAWATSNESEPSNSWVETAESDIASKAGNENALEEKGVDQFDAESNHEMNRTYKRNDW